MAHKYDTFWGAYGALAGKFNTVKQYQEWATLNAQQAYSGASNPVDKLHFGFATYAIECNANAIRNLAATFESRYDQSYLYEAIYWARYDTGDGEEYELTMEKILETIWNSDQLRWFLFINFIDSMRAGIWNIEIYDTHLAEWYRHFSTA